MQDLEPRADKAINFLAASDRKHAELKARLSSLNELRKTIKAFEYLEAVKSKGVSNGVAEQMAYASDKYKEHILLIEETEVAYQSLQNERVTACNLLDLYRTESANSRRGSA